MDPNINNKYTFLGEWFDRDAAQTRKFYVHFIPVDGSIELYDVINRKVYIRRTKVSDVTLDDLYIGSSVRLFGRLISIVDYGCEDTKRKLYTMLERTFALIKPNTPTGEIIQAIIEKGFKITKLKMVKLSKEDALFVYRRYSGNSLPGMLDYVRKDNVLVMELMANCGIRQWLQAMGDEDPEKAEPNTLRRRFGSSITANALYGSATMEESEQNIDFFFPPADKKMFGPKLTATFLNCTCCIVKPHAFKENNLGNIVKAITDANFKINAMNMYRLDTTIAAEFLEVYKGIVTEYMAMVDELSSGPCIVMEVVSNDSQSSTPVEFRKLVGPMDPEVARQLRPHTLRARFGRNKVQNAVHCSDLPEDGLLEVEYFFKIMES